MVDQFGFDFLFDPIDRKTRLEEVLQTIRFAPPDFSDAFFVEKDVDRPDDPVFLPYLAGERSPIRDPNASGCFFGLQLGTSKSDLIRSVMEGVAFSLYDCYLSLKPKNKKAVLIGGGASSPFWCQFLSTLLNIELDKPLENRDPSFGAALLAFQGSTQRPIPSASFERKTYLPNRRERPQLLKKYRQYKKLYLALKDSFQND